MSKKEETPKTYADLVRVYFPDADDKFVDFILWEKTGFPSFFPKNGKSEIDTLKWQLERFKLAISEGKDICRECADIAKVNKNCLCEQCDKEGKRKWQK